MLISFIFLPCFAVAQAGLGDPVFIQTFGEGNANPNTIGTQLPPGKTSFTFSDNLCPPPNGYTIARRINVNGCHNDSWVDLSKDNGPTDFGHMMIVNNVSNPAARLVYVDTVTSSLCPGALYSFFIAVINLSKFLECNPFPTFPRFAMNVENVSGQVLFADTTSPIGFASGAMGWEFAKFSFAFVMPALDRLVLRVNLLPWTWACAEDFAIDDIMLSPVGPPVKIEFENEPSTTIVKSFCFMHNRTISMRGTVDEYYTSTALQWQQSTDFGITWQDIPGATSLTYSRFFSTPDTFLFRLTAGEASMMANPNCRVKSNTRRVEVDDLPTNINARNNSPVCSGHELKFNAEGGASFEWRGPNGFNDNVAFPQISYSLLRDSGMYYVEATSLGGCKATDSTYAVIIGTDVKAGPDTLICLGNSIRLNASEGTKFEWWPSEELSSSTSRSPIVTPTSNQQYTVRVTDQYGCIDTARVYVGLLNKTEVKADFIVSEFLCRPSDSASFSSNSSGIIDSWTWNFGNGQTSNEELPTVQQYYIAPDVHSLTASLIVADTAGCSDTLTKTLHIAENCYIAVPTGFTPNADGLNDFLYPANAYKATNLKFRIFNRHGQLLFSSTHWSQKWDGAVRGVPQPTGVYVWMLEYIDASGRKVFLKGTSTLIR